MTNHPTGNSAQGSCPCRALRSLHGPLSGEVLSRLEEASLVSRKARGLEVAAIDTEKIVQVYDTRGSCWKRKWPDRPPWSARFANVFQLQAMLERERTLVDASDRTLIRSNLEFHAAGVVGCSQSRARRSAQQADDPPRPRTAVHFVHRQSLGRSARRARGSDRRHREQRFRSGSRDRPRPFHHSALNPSRYASPDGARAADLGSELDRLTAQAEYTASPPTYVARTSMSAIPCGSIVSGLSPRTVKSARYPGASRPL